MSRKLKLVGLALWLALMPACTHLTNINTEPEGAEVFINGVFVGTTPVTYRSRSGLPDTAILRIEKDGYEPIKSATIDKVYRADISLLLLLAAIVPYFFSARFEDDYVFKLRPAEAAEMPADAEGE